MLERTYSEDKATRHQVVIVGSGFSGVAMAIALKRDGIEDVVIR